MGPNGPIAPLTMSPKVKLHVNQDLEDISTPAREKSDHDYTPFMSDTEKKDAPTLTASYRHIVKPKERAKTKQESRE